MRGLQGRRIAVVADPADGRSGRADALIEALEKAGAEIERLGPASGKDAWQSTRYAALALIGGGESADGDARVVQLVREFLLAGKPLFAAGKALTLLRQAEGVSGRKVAAPAQLKGGLEGAGATVVGAGFHVDESLVTSGEESGVDAGDTAQRLIAAFADLLEEHDVDEASDLSFPASDPPAVSPGSTPAGRDGPRAGG